MGTESRIDEKVEQQIGPLPRTTLVFAPVEGGNRIAVAVVHWIVVPGVGAALHMRFVVLHIGVGFLRVAIVAIVAIVQVELHRDMEVMLAWGEWVCLAVPGVVL